MKMEKLKKIAETMIMGGAFGGVAGTLEGATLLGMVIGAAAGASEMIWYVIVDVCEQSISVGINFYLALLSSDVLVIIMSCKHVQIP